MSVNDAPAKSALLRFRDRQIAVVAGLAEIDSAGGVRDVEKQRPRRGLYFSTIKSSFRKSTKPRKNDCYRVARTTQVSEQDRSILLFWCLTKHKYDVRASLAEARLSLALLTRFEYVVIHAESVALGIIWRSYRASPADQGYLFVIQILFVVYLLSGQIQSNRRSAPERPLV